MNPLPLIIQNKWKNHILKIIDIKDFVVNTPQQSKQTPHTLVSLKLYKTVY